MCPGLWFYDFASNIITTNMHHAQTGWNFYLFNFIIGDKMQYEKSVYSRFRLH